MNSKVKVAADATTNAVIVSSPNNPEYGYVRLEQSRTVIDDNGFLRIKPVSTLIHGTIAELKAAGFYAGQELPGNLLIKESLTPFNAKNPERGQPIYRKTIYSAASNTEDTLIKHDNVEQLRNAFAAKAESAITPNTDFENL